MQKIHDALANRQIERFYSVTMLTIEGIMRRDRAGVFAGTRTVMQPETIHTTRNADLPDAIQEKVGSGDLELSLWSSGSSNRAASRSIPK
jgi:hypothetical protein